MINTYVFLDILSDSKESEIEHYRANLVGQGQSNASDRHPAAIN